MSRRWGFSAVSALGVGVSERVAVFTAAQGCSGQAG